jgi:uncharacterized protein YjbI with pentapeptide repeats
LPFFGVALPVVPFYAVIPLFYVLLHINVIAHYAILAPMVDKLRAALNDLRSPDQKDEQRGLIYLSSFSHMHLQTGTTLRMRFLVWLSAVVPLIVFPLLLLCWIQRQFLPYHSVEITWMHRAYVLIDLLVIWLYWPLRKGSRAQAGRLKRVYMRVSRVCSLLWADKRRKLGIVAHYVVSFAKCEFRRVACECRSVWGSKRRSVRHAMYHGVRVGPSVLIVAYTAVVAAVPDRAMDVFLPALRVWDLDWGAALERELHRNLVLREMILVEEPPPPELLAVYKVKDEDVEQAWIEHAKGLDLRLRDLRYADFSESTLYNADFRSANLTEVDLSEAKLGNARFEPYERDDGTKTPTLLTEANLAEADLREATLSQAVLEGADLEEVEACNSDFRGANLTEADLSEGKLANGRFDPYERDDGTEVPTLLTEASLWGADLRGADLRRAVLHGADLRRAKLHGADLSEAKLRGTNFGWAKLHGADLRKAELHGADLHRAELHGVDLSRAELHGVDLSRAELHGAELPRAKLHGAVLHDAELYGARLWAQWPDIANLWAAAFEGGNLWGAELVACDMQGARIGADFRKATVELCDLRGASDKVLDQDGWTELKERLERELEDDRKVLSKAGERLDEAAGRETEFPPDDKYISNCLVSDGSKWRECKWRTQDPEEFERILVGNWVKLACDDPWVAKVMAERAPEYTSGMGIVWEKRPRRGVRLADRLVNAYDKAAAGGEACDGVMQLEETTIDELREIVEGLQSKDRNGN